MATISKNENLNSSYNPEFISTYPDWKKMFDTNAGEREIKEATTEYLLKTEGQKNDKKNGSTRYANYVLRANYFNYVADTVISMLGVMYSEGPDKIELPDRINGMMKHATPANADLLDVARRINNNQLIFGRYGILVDVPDSEGITDPVLIEYKWDKIINWHSTISGGVEKLNFVVLDESGNVLNPIKNEWEYAESYRLLALDGDGVYYSRQLDSKDLSEIDILNPPISYDEKGNEIDIYPKLAREPLDFIPFVFVNTTNIMPSVEKPPLLALANLCIAIYRGDADYRQALFMQGQDTLFVSGMDPAIPLALGAGAAVRAENPDATMRYVGVTSNGLSKTEKAQEDLHDKAQRSGIALIDQSTQESGEALKTRLAIKTANMKTIALTGAVALKKALQIAAIWAQADEDEVSVIPNLDFSASTATAQQVLQLWTSKMQGLPLSLATIHEWLRQNDFTAKDFEEEEEEIENENTLL